MKKMEISKESKLIIIFINMFILIVSILGMPYSYFTVQVTGNDTESSMSLSTSSLSLIYWMETN